MDHDQSHNRESTRQIEGESYAQSDKTASTKINNRNLTLAKQIEYIFSHEREYFENSHFIFSEYAWKILLYLFIRSSDTSGIQQSELQRCAGLPAEIFGRHLAILVDERLIEGAVASDDRYRLTEEALQLLGDILSAAIADTDYYI
jgi:hypothetical protein